MIQGHLVCGINDDQIQKHLLSEGDQLTLTKAPSLAQAMEAATKDLQLLQLQSAQHVQTIKGKQAHALLLLYQARTLASKLPL